MIDLFYIIKKYSTDIHAEVKSQGYQMASPLSIIKLSSVSG
jgi:hypothetical protein